MVYVIDISHTFSQLWPIILAVLQRFKADSRIIERTCRCLRFILRCLRGHAASLLSPLVDVVC